MKALAATLAGLAALALAAPAAAQNHKSYVTHTIAKGDSLQLLAAEYYGERRHALFIMAVNNIDHSRKLKPGTRIKIPRAREVSTKVGDTFEALATTHLGDKRRAIFLAAFNGMKPTDSIPAGLTLRVPFHIRYRAKSPLSISTLAATYLGSANKAALLRRYNFLPDDTETLEKGATLIIPVYQVRLRESKRGGHDAESRTRIAKRKAMQERAARILEDAHRWWKEGKYAALKRELTKLDPDYLDADVAVEVAVLLGRTYVAFGDSDSALAIFKKALERRPTHALSSYAYSPKVRKVWRRAGGAVKTGK